MTDTDKLVNKIERSEHLFRLFQMLFMAAIVVILGFVVYNNNRLQKINNTLLSNQKAILEQQKDTAQKESASINTKLDQQTNIILCVIQKFVPPSIDLLNIQTPLDCTVDITTQSTAPKSVSPPNTPSVSKNQNVAAPGSKQP